MPFEKKRIGEGIKQQELNLEEAKEPVISFKDQVKKFQNNKTVQHVKQKFYVSSWNKFFLIPVIIVALFFVLQGVFALYQYSSDKNFLQTVFNPVLSELERDENGFVNIVLIGNGGGNHDGADLTDTMIVASIDTENQNVVMLSVPRDFWVETTQFGSTRINEIYRDAKNTLEKRFHLSEEAASDEAMRTLIHELETITDLSIPYYAQVDFTGLIDVVDTLGGIQVDVVKDIHDESYPDGNWGFEVFDLEKGEHILDGETALKYARSRHNSSDFDRSARQQQVLHAVKETALNSGILTSPRKIQGLFKVIQNHFSTNLNVKELVSLALIGSKIPKGAIVSAVLNDDWNTRGGFLGTPPRADYGGAFVLIPYSGFGDLSRIHVFTKILFQYRELQFEGFEVLNGTKIGGLATKAAQRLDRYGLTVDSIGNIQKTEDYYAKSELWVYNKKELLFELEDDFNEIFPVKFVDKTGVYEEVNVLGTFIIGTDYK